MIKYLIDLKYLFIGIICGYSIIFIGIKRENINKNYVSNLTVILFIIAIVITKEFGTRIFSLKEFLWDLLLGLAIGIFGAKVNVKR